MKTIMLIIYIFLSFFTNNTFAESGGNLELENKIKNLELRVELVKKSNDEYLEMVKWVVGLLFTLFWWIIFLNWFQSFKLWKKEIENIKEEINNHNYEKTKNFFNEINTKIESKINNKLSYLKDELYEIKHNLFMDSDIKYISDINNKLDLDLKHNEYNIWNTLWKAEKFIKNKKLRTDEKIEFKEFLEWYITKLQVEKNEVLDMEVLTCKSLITDYLN